MDVDAAQRRDIQHRLGQDFPIGHHHNGLRSQGADLRLHFFLAQCGRLIHWQAVPEGQLLHRRRGQLMAPAFGLVRLGEHSTDLIPPV